MLHLYAFAALCVTRPGERDGLEVAGGDVVFLPAFDLETHTRAESNPAP